jgi:hypothetical protein
MAFRKRKPPPEPPGFDPDRAPPCAWCGTEAHIRQWISGLTLCHDCADMLGETERLLAARLIYKYPQIYKRTRFVWGCKNLLGG